MLGGVFFGMTDRFERFAEIEPKDNVFAEFIPEGALRSVFSSRKSSAFLRPNIAKCIFSGTESPSMSAISRLPIFL